MADYTHMNVPLKSPIISGSFVEIATYTQPFCYYLNETGPMAALSAKEPLITGLFCGKILVQIRKMRIFPHYLNEVG